jgi:hypothetical protein
VNFTFFVLAAVFDIANMILMVSTLQEYVSSSGSDGAGATDAQIILALLYLLKCCMVFVFFVASTAVKRGATFRRMFCPHQRTGKRRAALASGSECSSDKQRALAFVPGHAGALVPQSAVDSFQFNLAATGYLYLVLLIWDGQLALSFEHFLDVNYGPVFLIYLLSIVKALLSIDINTGALSGGTASSSTTKSLYLNMARLLCVVVGFTCHLGKRFNVMFAQQREGSEGSGSIVRGGSGGSGSGSGGGDGGGGGGSGLSASTPAVAATTGGYAISDNDPAVRARSAEEQEQQPPQRPIFDDDPGSDSEMEV